MGFSEEFGEKNRGTYWVIRQWAFYFAIVFLTMVLAVPLEQMLRYGFHAGSWDYFIKFIQKVWETNGVILVKYYVYYLPQSILKGPDIFHLIPFIPMATFPYARIIILNTNPHDMYPKIDGVARKAKMEDVEEWGLHKGFITVLGKFEGTFLKLKDTLSVMAFAPPGTGKTSGIVVPTITECDDVSMIVHDPKPEVANMTSGYRSQKGITFTLNWGAEDDPEAGIYHPSWNPLAPDAIPASGPSRDLYVDSMISILIEEPKGSADPHWVNSGRKALAGMIHYIVSKTERARANDYFFNRLKDGTFDSEDARLLDGYYEKMEDALAEGAQQLLRDGKITAENYVPVGTWQDIPKNWIGHEACIPMMIDWLTEAKNAVSREIDERKKQGDQMAAMTDGMKAVFANAVKEVQRFGYAKKALTSFTDLANTPDKERGSILSTVSTNLNIFTNSAVRARTSHSDFHFKDLRGMRDPRDRKMKPVTVYISIDQVHAVALAPITGIFIELMSLFLIANKPENVYKGEKLGPYPTLFVVDEFPVLPKMDAVMRGPDIGRGQKVSYLLIAQDMNQIIHKYSEQHVETLFSSTAAKIILRQNNNLSAKRFSEMIGKKSAWKDTVDKNPKGIISFEGGADKLIKEELYKEKKIMSLPYGKQLIIYEGRPNVPIEADTPLHYQDETIKKKVYDRGCSGPVPADTLPPFLVENHKRRQIIDAGGN
ncbi:MAG: type IV secretory system conjugative DNA transfer family protein [Alphaproteobacteria bacterium]|nr:type IV secretory system conjugative DNA transfer family protein [Alphaproteobacteria bacterium]MBN2779562.1 type IV secretory system conjugative DNA transfer family protein [Alphaproteobacteria bacterium]